MSIKKAKILKKAKVVIKLKRVMFINYSGVIFDVFV